METRKSSLLVYRHFLTRKDVYKRALAMQNHINELEEEHKWGPKEMSFVQMALDAEMPINLHDVGELHIRLLYLAYLNISSAPLSFRASPHVPGFPGASREIWAIGPTQRYHRMLFADGARAWLKRSAIGDNSYVYPPVG